MSEEAEGTAASPRSGSYADLSRRMDKLESSHESLVRDVSLLSTSLARVESKQDHLEELQRLRFDALGASLDRINLRLTHFDELAGGQVDNPLTRQYWEERTERQKWQVGVDRWIAERDGQALYSARVITLLMAVVGTLTSAAMYLVTHVRF